MSKINAKNDAVAKAVGQQRLLSDKRQLGGMMIILGAAALIFPMANVSTLIGPDGTTANEGIPLSSLCAGVIVITMGVISMITGYMALVHDYTSRHLTGFLIVFGQLAYIPFITDLTNVGRGARSGSAFIPEAYGPSEGDVRFVGAMGMMGVLGYGTGFLGSLSFVQFALYSFQTGNPQARPGSYYRGRLSFYSFCLLLVGVSQLLLGSYVLSSFGNGPLPKGGIAVAMYMVNFPEISVFVGLVQILLASFGLARSFGVANGADNHAFQALAAFSWICTVSMQNLTQIAYAPGGTAAGMAPSVTMLTLGLNVLPAFLDYKMRSTPEDMESYYSMESVAEGGVPEPRVESEVSDDEETGRKS